MATNGIDARLLKSELLKSSLLLSRPSLWEIGTDFRWVYTLTPAQLSLLQSACDRRFGCVKAPDCVVSSFINQTDASYSVLSVEGSTAVIERTFMSYSDLELINSARVAEAKR